jgi:hypothetical protein
MTEAIEGELVDQSGALVAVTPGRDALTMFGDETQGIDRARRVANMLKGIVTEKNLSVRLGNSDHLKIEAWCACASMVGVAPLTEWVHEVRHPTSGDLEGYEARVQVVQIATGQVVGAAEAGCFFEETLTRRDGSTYERWTERHAVKSMAQTRATSKAIGQVLRWIPVLAGFSGTPYEEMPPGGYDGAAAPPKQRETPARVAKGAPPAREEGAANPAAQAFLFQPGDPQPPPPKFRGWADDAPTKNPESEFSKVTWKHLMGGSYGGKRYQWCRRVLAMDTPPASTAERARIVCWLIEDREHSRRADMAAAKGEETPF